MAVIRKLEPQEEQYKPPPKLKLAKKSEHDDSNWLISYADMMTLLCVFYIMLFSMAKVNTPEFEKVKKEVAEHFGSKYESPTEDLGKFINNVIVEAGAAKDATMTSDGVSVTIAFNSTLFFDTLSAEISPAGKAILNQIITKLAEHQQKHGKSYKVVVEGHTDSQAITAGPFPSNWELSSARATRVVRLFLENKFNPQNMLAIGYADTQPVAESRNPDGTWNTANLAKNRRVILRVLLPEVDTIPWQGKSVTPNEIKTIMAPQNGTSAPAAKPAVGQVAANTAPAAANVAPVVVQAAPPANAPAAKVTAPVSAPVVTAAPPVAAKVAVPVNAPVATAPTTVAPVTAPAAAAPAAPAVNK